MKILAISAVLALTLQLPFVSAAEPGAGALSNSAMQARMRGAGDLLGTAQSGLPRFRIADPESQTALLQTAQRDARALIEVDPELSSARGNAARKLLWLLGQDRAIQMISVG